MREQETTFGGGTRFGGLTVFKTPETTKQEEQDLLFANLTASLYPTGRVWNMKKGSDFNLFHDVINKRFIQLLNDSRLFIDSSFPDNENFDINDIRLWENRLGLITNETVNVDIRRSAVLRKFAYPGNTKARQHPLFIQSQLQKAGFDVYIYENTFPYREPVDISDLATNKTQHGDPTQHGGGTQTGTDNYKVIANSLDPEEFFDVPIDQLHLTFFIGGSVLGQLATIEQNRITEFRELVLKLKPANMIGWLFIKYI